MEFYYTQPKPGGLYFDDQPHTQMQKSAVAFATETHTPMFPPVKPLPRGSLATCGSLTTTTGNCACPVPSMAPYISPPQGLNTNTISNALFAANHSASFQCPSSGGIGDSFSTYGRPMTTEAMLKETQQFMRAGYGARETAQQYGDIVDAAHYEAKGLMGYMEPTMTTKANNNFYRQGGIGGYSSDSHKAPINQHGFISNHEVMNILAGEDASIMANKLDFRSGQGSMFNGNKQTFDANRQMQNSYSSMARENPQHAAEALAGGFVNGSSVIPTFGMVQQGFLRLGVQRNGQLMDRPVYRNNPAALKVQNTLQYNGRYQKIPHTSGDRLNYPPQSVLPVEFDSMVASKCDS